MRKAWRNFGPWIIGGAVAIVIGYAAYQGWVWYQKNAAAAASDQFYSAMALADGEDHAAAQKALDDIVAKGGGYATLAKFREAALLAKDGKVDEAVAAYDALAASEPGQLKQVATVQAANLLIDKGNVADTAARLKPIIDNNSSLTPVAREILGLTQYKAGQYDDALVTFTAIMQSGVNDQALLSRVSVYTFQAMSAGGKLPVAPETTAPEVDATVSTESSVGVDASAELDVTPPSVEASSAEASSAASSSAEASSSAAESSSAQ